MNIKIIKGADNAIEATGIAVVIDVFRAMSVEAYIANNNVEKLIPVGDKEVAYSFKEKDDSIILVGERGGVILPGFDFGNSPTNVKDLDFTGKTVVHTTSAGTQGLVGAVNAKEIITGCFLNAKAIVRYIKEKGYEEVSLVCTNYSSKEKDEEDTLCAEYIKSLLEGKDEDYTKIVDDLRYTCGARFFKEELKDVFPSTDFELCTKLNIFNFVLKFTKQTETTGIITKINV